jgi:hypothetical protein
MAWRILGGALVLLAATALVTFALGEAVPRGELYTRDHAGAWVGTKLWVVDQGDATWVRVARPGRRWFRRLRVDPHVELERDGVRAAYVAHAHPEAVARARIDAAFREQNGAIDWWFGVVLRSDAIPVELVPVP